MLLYSGLFHNQELRTLTAHCFNATTTQEYKYALCFQHGFKMKKKKSCKRQGESYSSSNQGKTINHSEFNHFSIKSLPDSFLKHLCVMNKFIGWNNDVFILEKSHGDQPLNMAFAL